MLLVALQVLQQFLLLLVVLPELRLQELVFQQELLVELLELQEQKLRLFLGFELQHWQLEHRSLVFLEQLVVLVFLLLVLQLQELPLGLLEFPLLEQLEQLCYLRLLV